MFSQANCRNPLSSQVISNEPARKASLLLRASGRNPLSSQVISNGKSRPASKREREAS